MATKIGKSALLLGGTGAVGKKLLAELLASDEWARVGEYGRHVSATPQAQGPPAKLEQKVIDFEDLGKAELKAGRWDVVFVTLGTSRATAGSAAQFEKIDRECVVGEFLRVRVLTVRVTYDNRYVVRACEAAKTDDPTHEQRVVYLSSPSHPVPPLDTNTAHRSKGLTELGLARLGYADTIVFRPALLRGAERPERRIAESIFGYGTLVRLVSFSRTHAPFFLLQHLLRRRRAFQSTLSKSRCVLSSRSCSPSRLTPHAQVSLLAKSMAKAGALGSSRIPANVGATKVDAGQDTWYTLLSNKAAALLGGK
ncbi:hypothetical protein J3R82DRAFT_2623 [Butyriboletus roseoflavus]|nr:hypothetical protein J3R82DRAFT_2623 [Butyriboletus roseoflavus]